VSINKEGVLVEYRKHIFGEIVKVLTTAIVTTLLFWGGQNWLTSDLEYKQVSRNAYLSAPLGKQGLTMAYEGKPLKNVSVVEFGIVNRTSKQLGDVDLIFSVDDSQSPMTLVSSGIITPSGLPHTETVEELPTKDTGTKKFRLKVIPKQTKTEYFHAVFVFDGEKAPSMSVVSQSKDNVAIVAYQEWKDNLIVPLVYTCIYLLIGVAMVLGLRRSHRKSLERFAQHAAELQEKGELKSADEQAVKDAITIYTSFMRPKGKFLSKIVGAQRLHS
jgi:hypothetical protein